MGTTQVAGDPAAPSGIAPPAGVPFARRLRRALHVPAGLPFTLPLLLLLVVAFNLPLLGVFLQSLGGASELTAAYYRELIDSPAYLGVLTNTFRIAAVVTIACSVLAYPLSYWIARLSRRARIAALILVILPFWTSILVRTYSWVILLGVRGVVNETLLALGLIGSPLQLIYNDLGVAIGMVHVLMPFIVLPLVAAMLAIDERLLKAGASLGAPPRTVFWRIYFPLSMPALAAGGILVFILSLGFFVTPAILGGGRVSMIATVLDTMINRVPRWELASAMSTVLLLASLAFYGVYRRVGGIIR